MTKKDELVGILEEMAVLMELADLNAFKTKAIQNGARILDKSTIDVEAAASDSLMATQAGLGKGIQEILREFVQSGRVAEHERLKTLVPEGVLSLTKLRGVGAKKAKALHEQLDINSIGELEYACRENRLIELKGFGVKTQAAILQSIETWNSAQGRLLQHRALRMSEELQGEFQFAGASRIHVGGQLQRACEVIEELCFVCLVEHPHKFAEVFGAPVHQHSMRFHRDGVAVLVVLSSEENWAVDCFRASCAESFLREFEHRYELKPVAHEEQIFSQHKLSVISAELREDPALIEEAKHHTIPELVRNEDMRGMLHIHTHWSDGVHTIREMALEAKRLGFEYIAVCDHSKTAFYANGLSVDRVYMQHEEIDKLNEENLGIRILKGIESDILSDGSLDYDEAVLERFDMIVASVHSAFQLSKEAQTERIIRAIRSPYTTIVGHPTGRLLLSRKGYELDIEAILEAAAEHGTIIELNANPHRFDLDWRWHRRAVELGVRIGINPDSHQAPALAEVFLGVGIARKGMLRSSDVINTLGLNDFLTYCAQLKARKQA